MGVAVTDNCGIKAPMRTPYESVAGFAAALNELALGGPRFESLSRGALARARELDWDNKAAAMARTYESVISANTAAA
jgi:hypothetical protein